MSQTTTPPKAVEIDLTNPNTYLYSKDEDLYFHIHPNGVAEFRLNRPKKMNTLSTGFVFESLRLLKEIEHQPFVTLVLFWSADPQSWSAGGDVVHLTNFYIQSLVENKELDVDMNSLCAPSTSPTSLYTPSPTLSNPTPSQALFSGHVNPEKPLDVPENAKDGLKLKPIEGYNPWRTDMDPTILPMCEFFFCEYSLLHMLSNYSKPSMSLLSGVSFGGGAGLAMATNLKLASMSLCFGMPETRIGLIPDVGSSYFFSHTPYGNPMGRFLATTGYNLNAPEMLKLGLVDGIFPQDQFYCTFFAITSLSKDTISSIFSQTPRPIDPSNDGKNKMTKEEMYMLKQQHKNQLQNLVLKISTSLCPPKENHPPERLGLYIPTKHINYAPINKTSAFLKLTMQIEQFLEQKSFLFGNLSDILDIFGQSSYHGAVQKINSLVQIGFNQQLSAKQQQQQQTESQSVSSNKIATINHVNHLLDKKTIACAQKLQKMLAPMCPASCVLTYQMHSPIYKRVVALQSIARQVAQHHDQVNYPLFNQEVNQYQGHDAEKTKNTPMIFDRFIHPIKMNPYKSHYTKSPSPLTTSLLLKSKKTPYIQPLSYDDYVRTEFIHVGRSCLSDYSNLNFISGVTAHLTKRHFAPKWFLFTELLEKHRYLIDELYPEEISRGIEMKNNGVSFDEWCLYQEECWLLLYSLPLPFSPPNLRPNYLHFPKQPEPRQHTIVDPTLIAKAQLLAKQKAQAKKEQQRKQQEQHANTSPGQAKL